MFQNTVARLPCGSREFVALILMSIFMYSCEAQTDDSLVGTWRLTSVDSITIRDFQNAIGIDGLVYELSFSRSGRALIYIQSSGGGLQYSGTWKAGDGNLTFSVNEQSTGPVQYSILAGKTLNTSMPLVDYKLITSMNKDANPLKKMLLDEWNTRQAYERVDVIGAEADKDIHTSH